MSSGKSDRRQFAFLLRLTTRLALLLLFVVQANSTAATSVLAFRRNRFYGPSLWSLRTMPKHLLTSAAVGAYEPDDAGDGFIKLRSMRAGSDEEASNDAFTANSDESESAAPVGKRSREEADGEVDWHPAAFNKRARKGPIAAYKSGDWQKAERIEEAKQALGEMAKVCEKLQQLGGDFRTGNEKPETLVALLCTHTFWRGAPNASKFIRK